MTTASPPQAGDACPSVANRGDEIRCRGTSFPPTWRCRPPCSRRVDLGPSRADRRPYRTLSVGVPRTPRELADLAFQFALGGADVSKDDQGLMDQPFCPFNERVSRCAEAVTKGAMQRGRPCLYMPHVSGSLDRMRRWAHRAKRAGAGGLLVAPGLTGFDSLRALAEDDALALPIASHPSLLGSYAAHPTSGIAPPPSMADCPASPAQTFRSIRATAQATP